MQLFWIDISAPAVETEDGRKVNDPPTFNGYTYSGETSDDEDPNDAYYYADSDREQRTGSLMCQVRI